MGGIPQWRTYPSDKPGGRKLEVGDLNGDACIYKGINEGR